MIRRVSAVVIALFLNGITLHAQTTGPQGPEITVNIASASVHRSPSVGSPVVGKAQRGTVLAITRNLGSWVEVPWSESENGVAFLHVNSGSIAHHGAPFPNPLAAPAPAMSASAPLTGASASASASASAEQVAGVVEPGSRRQVYVSLPSHIFGVGGRMSGSVHGFGVSARKWWGNTAVQFEVSRSMLGRADGPGELRATQFAPSVLYALPDAISNALWLRPYVGGGASIYRATVGPALATSTTEQRTGFQTFGGGEVTFSGVPQFSLSADIGYRWRRTPLAGFEPDKIGYSLSGHWYVK